MQTLTTHKTTYLMKRLILSLVCLTATAAVAQPPARLREAQAKTKTAETVPQGSAYRDFPTAQPMPGDAPWRRDVYRTVDLTVDANAALYYPTQPTAGRENLFTYLFKLLLRGQIKAYDYKLDGNEDFSEDNRVKAKELMDRYQIFYESKDGRMRVNDADLPSAEVTAYFVKESTYYDQRTATFRTQVTALCPVLRRADEFGGETQYPMFWVRYADVAPFLAKLSLMGSSLNNAATLTADDYFTMNRYEGKIYKTTNLQDKVLANYCTTDSALVKEQARIEKQITDFKKHVWGQDSIPPQPEDSLAADEEKPKAHRTRTPRRRGAAEATSGNNRTERKAAVAEQKRTRSSRSSGGATYSVRRQRH